MPNQKPARSHFIALTGVADGILMPRADLVYSFQDAGKNRELKHRYGKDTQSWNIRQSMDDIRRLAAEARMPDLKRPYGVFVALHTPEGKALDLRAEYICALYKKMEGGPHNTVVYFGLGDVPACEVQIRETPEEAALLIDEALSPARPGLPRPLDPRF